MTELYTVFRGRNSKRKPKGRRSCCFRNRCEGLGTHTGSLRASDRSKNRRKRNFFQKKGLTKSDSCGILYESDKNGVWHSLVVRLVRDQEAAGSSPVTPTIFVVRKGYNLKKLRFSGLFLYSQGLLRLLRRLRLMAVFSEPSGVVPVKCCCT